MKFIILMELLLKPRIPWRIQDQWNKGLNRIYYYYNKLQLGRVAAKGTPLRKRIIFHSGFHGRTGSTYAIASIANLLSTNYDVEFVSFPQSHFNPLLNESVKLVKSLKTDGDLYVCSLTSDIALLEGLNHNKRPIVITCHGLLNTLHGLSEQHVRKALDLAHKVHFVSAVQQDSFRLRNGQYFIIPNTNKPILKTTSTNNVGMVGNLAEPRKNVRRGLEIALTSEAGSIHLWGADKLDLDPHPRIKVHGWCNNKDKIYGSFDVLVALSDTETFGLVVTEALSAGIPCLLSNIAAFRQFKNCPGVELVDGNGDDIVNKLNGLLKSKNDLKDGIRKFWTLNYSNQVIEKQWRQAIEGLLV